jgi:hypothetical protein
MATVVHLFKSYRPIFYLKFLEVGKASFTQINSNWFEYCLKFESNFDRATVHVARQPLVPATVAPLPSSHRAAPFRAGRLELLPVPAPL